MAIQQNPFGKKNEKENKHKNMMGKKKLIKTITISNAIIRLTKFTMQYTSG